MIVQPACWTLSHIRVSGEGETLALLAPLPVVLKAGSSPTYSQD